MSQKSSPDTFRICRLNGLYDCELACIIQSVKDVTCNFISLRFVVSVGFSLFACWFVMFRRLTRLPSLRTDRCSEWFRNRVEY